MKLYVMYIALTRSAVVEKHLFRAHKVQTTVGEEMITRWHGYGQAGPVAGSFFRFTA